MDMELLARLEQCKLVLLFYGASACFNILWSIGLDSVLLNMGRNRVGMERNFSPMCSFTYRESFLFLFLGRTHLLFTFYQYSQ